MKPSKLQTQFAAFKAEFAALCRQFGGQPHANWLHNGPDTAFLIPCADPRHGIMWASIHLPWSPFDGQPMLGAGRGHYSSSEIYLSFHGEVVPDFSCEPWDGRPHHKWNIHRSTDAGGQYVECCHESLTEFRRRLAIACGPTPAALSREEVAA